MSSIYSALGVSAVADPRLLAGGTATSRAFTCTQPAVAFADQGVFDDLLRQQTGLRWCQALEVKRPCTAKRVYRLLSQHLLRGAE